MYLNNKERISLLIVIVILIIVAFIYLWNRLENDSQNTAQTNQSAVSTANEIQHQQMLDQAISQLKPIPPATKEQYEMAISQLKKHK